MIWDGGGQKKKIVGASNAAAVTSSVPTVLEVFWGENPPLANKKDQNAFSESHPYPERGIGPNTKIKIRGGGPPAHSQFCLLTPRLISQTKHKYITSRTTSPESHVVAAAQQLVTALLGSIPAGNEMVEALTRVSKLFIKVAIAKKEVAKAKEQRNRLRANSLAQITTHLLSVAVPPPMVDVPVPRLGQSPSG